MEHRHVEECWDKDMVCFYLGLEQVNRNRRPETCSYIYASIGYEVHIKNIGSKLTTTEPVWDQITFLYGKS